MEMEHIIMNKIENIIIKVHGKMTSGMVKMELMLVHFVFMLVDGTMVRCQEWED